MANLVTTTISGTNPQVSGMVLTNRSDITDWYKISTCPGGTGTHLHVRTPVPADTSVVGWNPIILEVIGNEGVDTTGALADIHHEFKALVNVNGYNNDWYGSQIMSNSGQNSTPFVYRSSSTYGGVTRVCFSITRKSVCANGNIWVRWWNSRSAFSSFAWAVTTSDSSTTPSF
jgi:hypothetical protein